MHDDTIYIKCARHNKFENHFWKINSICGVGHTFEDNHLIGDILILSIIWDSKDRSEIPTW